ncbi:hypothetical protein LTR78_009077 [Recurvomyces mirabilis]|uniref:Uncharacterized protein n=1 Tax=Recurvomyces mirabilis TaxID=574656 RepID=A0AAE0TU52_9PEZI|nr:hypothetical protein LTR78_009077 [Recurvomyces mirabilis]KAK5150394.1 hypothetical protein LTS14_010084 [Recurvomyces mirabilis]
MTSARTGPSTIVKRSGPACNGQHCQMSEGHCTLKTCEDRLRLQTKQIESKIASLANGFDEHLRMLERLKADIYNTCNTETFLSPEMEAIRLDVTQAMRMKVEPAFCVHFAAGRVLGAWQVKVKAVEKRSTALQQYRRAYETETLARTSSSCGGTKFFTPVGATKAKGVTALRLAPQVQSSYNYTALATNDMAARPFKTTWCTTPKTLRVVINASAKTSEG